MCPRQVVAISIFWIFGLNGAWRLLFAAARHIAPHPCPPSWNANALIGQYSKNQHYAGLLRRFLRACKHSACRLNFQQLENLAPETEGKGCPNRRIILRLKNRHISLRIPHFQFSDLRLPQVEFQIFGQIGISQCHSQITCYFIPFFLLAAAASRFPILLSMTFSSFSFLFSIVSF